MSALMDSVIGSCGSGAHAERPLSLKALAWARVSTDMQEERGLSMPEQLRQIREYAEKHGIEILEEYHEAASAFKKESQRVEFHRMLDRAKAGKDVNAILVHDFSRFSRDSLKARMLIRELKQHGVRVVSLNDIEVDSESVAGVYMEAITFAKNEAYSRECQWPPACAPPMAGWCAPLFLRLSAAEKLMHVFLKAAFLPVDVSPFAGGFFDPVAGPSFEVRLLNQ